MECGTDWTRMLYILPSMRTRSGAGLVGVIVDSSNEAAAPTGLHEGQVCGRQVFGLQHPLVHVENRAGNRTYPGIQAAAYA